MSIITVGRKVVEKFYIRRDIKLFNSSYEDQKKILDSFHEPQSLLERSVFQYKCQMRGLPFLLRAAQNLVAVFLIPYYMFKSYTRSNRKYFNCNGKAAVFLREGITNEIIPDTLKKEYSTLHECSTRGAIILKKKDKRFIYSHVMKYWYLPFFCLKSIIKIGIYSNVVHTYNPNAIITHNEYSFTSSLLTAYCRSIEVEHINVMHGEKLYNIRDSFVAYDRYYVWDVHYVNLMVSLRAEYTQFYIETPQIVCPKVVYQAEKVEYDLTYYLSRGSKKELVAIASILQKLQERGLKVTVRYHPRYTDSSIADKLFFNVDIEDSADITIDKSLLKTKSVVAQYSTVLYQASCRGKMVIIDDITNQGCFLKLRDLKYIMLEKDHKLLSELL